MKHLKSDALTLLCIAVGSLLYAVAIQFFIFSNSLFLGGTSGLSVILNHFFPDFSSGQFLMAINVGLMILALIILGKSMAVKTMIGSALTTFFVGLLEKSANAGGPLVSDPILAAIIGSSLIAIGSAILFYVDSSSGGTDIVALIIQKYSSIKIGRALLIADVLIVIIGACVSPLLIAVASVIGLFIKTLGIDVVISAIKGLRKRVLHA